MKHILILSYLIVITLGLTHCYAPPPQTPHIAFVSKRNQTRQLYLMDSQGKNQTQFTDETTLKPPLFPLSLKPLAMAWSPDGTTLAFDTGNYKLCTKAVFTSELKCFDFTEFNYLAWSLDGQWLAIGRRDYDTIANPGVLDGFELEVGTAPFPIKAIKPRFPIRHPARSEEMRLCSRKSPTWSPDSQRIAFTLNCVDPRESGIYTIGRNGQDEQQIYGTDKYISEVAWSPNGQEFVFTMQVEDDLKSASYEYHDGNCEIYRISINGTGLTRLTENSALDYEPTWSPDGQFIAFSSNRRGNYDIYVMKADGSDVHALTDDPADDYAPLWSPR